LRVGAELAADLAAGIGTSATITFLSVWFRRGVEIEHRGERGSLVV
jgi:hypothetical protein